MSALLKKNFMQNNSKEVPFKKNEGALKLCIKEYKTCSLAVQIRTLLHNFTNPTVAKKVTLSIPIHFRYTIIPQFIFNSSFRLSNSTVRCLLSTNPTGPITTTYLITKEREQINYSQRNLKNVYN